MSTTMGSQVTGSSSSSQTPTHPSELEKNKTNPPSKFTTLLLSPKDLQSNSSLLKQLRSVINEAYKSTHLKLEKDFNVPSYSIFPGFRLDDEFQLIRELPEDSRLAIMFDEVENSDIEEHIEDIGAGGNRKNGESTNINTGRETKDEEVTTNGTNVINDTESSEAATPSSNVKTATEKKKKLIAVASIKPWQGSVMSKYNRRILASSSDTSRLEEKSQLASSSSSSVASAKNTQKREELLDKPKQKQDDEDEDEDYWDWEIATCACVDDTKYRRMGIVSKLIELLLDELKEKRQASSEISTPKIKLWVSALGGSYNVEYWQKRGFKIVEGASGNVGPDTAPPGVWGNAKDIQIWTLNKVLVD